MDDSREMDGMTPKELAEVQRVHDVMLKAMDQEIWQMARCVVTKRDDQLFGQTEFTLREKVLRMGAQALEASVNDRKKRAAKAAATFALTAVKVRGSLGGESEPS